MAEPEQLDRETLEQRLREIAAAVGDEEGRRIAAAIAHRAAMRVLPLYWRWTTQGNDSSSEKPDTLPVLRASLVAGVAGQWSLPGRSDAVSTASTAASAAASAASATDDVEAYNDVATAAWAAVDATAEAPNAVAPHLAAAAAAATYANTASASWNEVSEDLTSANDREMPVRALWRGGDLSGDLWGALKSDILASPDVDDWRFWVEWYDAAREGRLYEERNKELLTEIALLPNDVWESGPSAVAEAIRKITGDRSPLFPPSDDIAQAEARALKAEDALAQEQEGRKRDAAEAEAEIGRLSEAAKAASAEVEALKAGLLKDARAQLDDYGREAEGVKASAEAAAAQAEKTKEEIDALIASATEGLALAEPLKLWERKRAHHEAAAKTAESVFRWTLCLIVVGVSLALLFFILGDVAALLLPAGCDVAPLPDHCHAFGLKGVLTLASFFTVLTIGLWFARLKMKEYLSERHLSEDARERQAFIQAYIGLIEAGHVTADAKDRKEAEIVFQALFRPTQDGIVKDEGGFDPSLSALAAKMASR